MNKPLLRFFLAADLITYDNDYSINNVNNNITLLKAISLPNDTEQINIFWESSDIEVIKIQNNFGIVTLTDGSQSVTLKATLLISDTVFKVRELDLIIKPKPLPLMHSVTLDLDGGMINGQINLTYSIEHGDTMPVPSNPVKQEFIFIEWQLNGLKYNFDSPITSDITLIAVYEEKPLIEMVTVLFDIGDGSVMDGVALTYEIEKNTVFNKPSWVPNQDGYIFISWQLDGLDYDFLTVVETDITLVATYQDINEYNFDIIQERLEERYLNNSYLFGEQIELIYSYDDLPDYKIEWGTDPVNALNENYEFVEIVFDKVTLLADVSGNDTSRLIEINVNVSGAVVPPSDYGPYYDSINATEGDNLLTQLQTLVTGSLGTTGSGNITYGEVRYLLEKSDLNSNGSGYLWGIYDNYDITAKWDYGDTWDREHVWPQSRLGISSANNSKRNIASDPHNLRASKNTTNGSRGNRYFVSGSGANKTVGSYGYYPGDEHIGDVARILLFMAVRYKDVLSLTQNPSGTEMGDIRVLYNWHLEDPVDDFEIQRNNVIHSHQGNRNPFIDRPEYFQPVWEYFMQKAQLQAQAIETMKNTIASYELNATRYVELERQYI